MQLKSLEKILDGVGKLRAASLVAWVANNAAFLGLNIPSKDQAAGVIGATILLAVVNVADGYIRGQHASALPALIAQGAESVAQVKDPRVDDIALSIESLAQRVEAVQQTVANQRPAPTLAEIVNELIGRGAAAHALPHKQQPAAQPQTPPVPPAPANPGLSA